jgi:hypothetical protein
MKNLLDEILKDTENPELRKVLLRLGKKIKHPYPTSIPKVRREYKLWLESKRLSEYAYTVYMLAGTEYFGAIIEKIFIDLELKMEEI